MSEYKPPIHLIRNWTGHFSDERPLCGAAVSIDRVWMNRTTLQSLATCPDCLRAQDHYRYEVTGRGRDRRVAAIVNDGHTGSVLSCPACNVERGTNGNPRT